MKHSLVVGVILILIGAAVLAWPVVTYTETNTVMDLGPVEVTAENEERIELPPVFGGLSVAAGLALVLLGGRRRGA